MMADEELTDEGLLYRPRDPFGDSLEFTASKEFHLDTFQREIAEEFGVEPIEVKVAISRRSFEEKASKANPATIYVSVEGGERKRVRKVIDTHTPPEPPSEEDYTEAALARLHAGDVLNLREVTLLLRRLL